jgi:DNA-binding PadR family transcriptional regulator
MNDLLLLATLLDGPQHGYALKRRAGLISGQRDLHNNIVYPLLKKFVEAGWVGKRTAAGERGQTRELYALTRNGKTEIVRRLAEFGEKEACRSGEFRLRVGLFAILDSQTRKNILAQRDRWLTGHEEKLTRLGQKLRVGKWGGEVVKFMLKEICNERKWIAGVRKKVSRERKSASVS